MKMKLTIIILSLLLASALVHAGGYEVPLTKGFADTLYCRVNANCNMISLVLDNLVVGNLTIINGNITWINVTIINYTVIGEVNIEGDIIVDNIFANFYNWIIKLGRSRDYADFNGTDWSFNETTLNNTIKKLDTNASTACDDDDYLDGNGLCIAFNATVLDLTKTVFFNATSISTITGTPEGTLEDIQSYNSISYNVTEDASDFELRVNFTGIIDFNNLIIRYKAEVDFEAHDTHIEIWDYVNLEWEHKGDLPSEPEWNIPEFGIFDSTNHIGTGDDLGVVQVRVIQDGGLPPRTHKHEFDWITISLGLGTPAQEEVDPHFDDWLMKPIFNGDVPVNGSSVNSSWKNIFITGNVGIGTNNPNSELEVTGNTQTNTLNVTGTATLVNINATDGTLEIDSNVNMDGNTIFGLSTLQAKSQNINFNVGIWKAFPIGFIANGAFWRLVSDGTGIDDVTTKVSFIPSTSIGIDFNLGEVGGEINNLFLSGNASINDILIDGINNEITIDGNPVNTTDDLDNRYLQNGTGYVNFGTVNATEIIANSVTTPIINSDTGLINASGNNFTADNLHLTTGEITSLTIEEVSLVFDSLKVPEITMSGTLGRGSIRNSLYIRGADISANLLFSGNLIDEFETIILQYIHDENKLEFTQGDLYTFDNDVEIDGGLIANSVTTPILNVTDNATIGGYINPNRLLSGNITRIDTAFTTIPIIINMNDYGQSAIAVFGDNQEVIDIITSFTNTTTDSNFNPTLSKSGDNVILQRVSGGVLIGTTLGSAKLTLVGDDAIQGAIAPPVLNVTGGAGFGGGLPPTFPGQSAGSIYFTTLDGGDAGAGGQSGDGGSYIVNLGDGGAVNGLPGNFEFHTLGNIILDGNTNITENATIGGLFRVEQDDTSGGFGFSAFEVKFNVLTGLEPDLLIPEIDMSIANGAGHLGSIKDILYIRGATSNVAQLILSNANASKIFAITYDSILDTVVFGGILGGFIFHPGVTADSVTTPILNVTDNATIGDTLKVITSPNTNFRTDGVGMIKVSGGLDFNIPILTGLGELVGITTIDEVIGLKNGIYVLPGTVGNDAVITLVGKTLIGADNPFFQLSWNDANERGLLATSTGSNANIDIEPDGTGIVNILSSVNITGNTILGSPSNIRNITMFTNPSGNPACCGVMDDMSFGCTAGVCAQ